MISYAPFDELIASLRTDGLNQEADRLHELIHKVAWTTGSELLGEVGQEMKKLEKAHRGKFSPRTKTKIDEGFEMVARVWPRFRR